MHSVCVMVSTFSPQRTSICEYKPKQLNRLSENSIFAIKILKVANHWPVFGESLLYFSSFFIIPAYTVVLVYFCHWTFLGTSF